jgi:capsular polysaccharide biosynthesis protein
MKYQISIIKSNIKCILIICLFFVQISTIFSIKFIKLKKFDQKKVKRLIILIPFQNIRDFGWI